MASFVKVLGLIAVLTAGAAIAAEVVMLSGSVRYKMTVEVETPEGLKTGSAVREVRMVTVPNILGPGSKALTGGAGAVGEAVVVDLGKRGKLFGLLGEDYAYRVLFKSFPWPGGPGGELTPDGIRYYTSLKEGHVDITKKKFNPIFVHFRNIDDPKSVEALYPVKDPGVNGLGGTPEKDFEDIFGKGVFLKAIYMDITNEPVTWEIDGVLPWLSKLNGGYLDGEFTGRNAPLGLHGGYFKTRNK